MSLPSGTVTFLFTDIEGSTMPTQMSPSTIPGSQCVSNAGLAPASRQNHSDPAVCTSAPPTRNCRRPMRRQTVGEDGRRHHQQGPGRDGETRPRQAVVPHAGQEEANSRRTSSRTRLRKSASSGSRRCTCGCGTCRGRVMVLAPWSANDEAGHRDQPDDRSSAYDQCRDPE